MGKWTRRAALLGTGAVIGGVATNRLTARNPSLDGTASTVSSSRAGTLNDASLLSETPIYKHIIMQDDPGDALVAAIRAEMKDARENNRPVNVSAARHSMGGQAIPLDGHCLLYTSPSPRDLSTSRMPSSA